ncbi:MAG: hypothetical protein LC800_14885 [Acidobacteria bacterium]|nr:hypothetical protein [Acidobacteriota bacterium]
MTLREVEKEAVLIGRRWLHDLVFADWGLKIVAFMIALGLWFAVTGQRAPATARMRGVPLLFVLPPDMEVSNEPREEVEVTLRGSRRTLDAVRAGDLAVTYDASAQRPGERLVRLTPSGVRLELPEGVSREGLTIERIEPATIPLRLERRVERELEVEPRLEGRPPEGYEVLGVESRPARVRVRGPEGHVGALRKAPTESVLLEGRTENFVAAQTAIDISDRKVVPLDAVTDVLVRVGEVRSVRRFDGVEVRLAGGVQGEPQPARVSVELRGPRTAVENLRAEDVVVVLEPGGQGPPRARLLLPPALEGRVELVSTQPAQLKIK